MKPAGNVPGQHREVNVTTSTICPRCGIDMTDEPGGGALSRVDNATYICSPCGTAEAMYNLVQPMRDLPPLDEPIMAPSTELSRQLQAVTDSLASRRVLWDEVTLSDLRTGEYRDVRLITDPDGVTFIEIRGEELPVRWVQ